MLGPNCTALFIVFVRFEKMFTIYFVFWSFRQYWPMYRLQTIYFRKTISRIRRSQEAEQNYTMCKISPRVTDLSHNGRNNNDDVSIRHFEKGKYRSSNEIYFACFKSLCFFAVNIFNF